MSRRCWHTERLAEEMTIVSKEDIFATRLRELMNNPPKTTQQELARYLGVQRQTISGYMLGRSSPDWKNLAKIAKYFNVSADYLLDLPEVETAPIDLKAVCEYIGMHETVVMALRDRQAVSLKTSINDVVSWLTYTFLE